MLTKYIKRLRWYTWFETEWKIVTLLLYGQRNIVRCGFLADSNKVRYIPHTLGSVVLHVLKDIPFPKMSTSVIGKTYLGMFSFHNTYISYRKLLVIVICKINILLTSGMQSNPHTVYKFPLVLMTCNYLDTTLAWTLNSATSAVLTIAQSMWSVFHTMFIGMLSHHLS